MPVSLGREIAKLALPAAAPAGSWKILILFGQGVAAATTLANGRLTMILSFGAIGSAMRHHRAVGRAVA